MYEKLICQADMENIEVVSWPLQGKTKGLYCDGFIALNKNIPTTSERACIIAEELGHYYTSSGDIIDQRNTVNKKQEVKARRWAVKRLVTLKNIINAFKAGCRNMYEMAEYLGVTEEFLREAFHNYGQMYGVCKKRGSYTIYFDPPGVYKNTEVY